MNIGILYNCAREDLFIVYQSKVRWASLLQYWIKSSHPAIKLQCMFLLGFISSYLSQSDSLKLMSSWSQEDMKSVMNLLTSSTLTTTLTAKYNRTLFSADELLVNILNLIHLSKENYDIVASPEMLQTYISLLQKGSEAVVVLTCQVLWELSYDSLFRDIAIPEISLSLCKQVDLLCQSTKQDIMLVGKCLQISMRREPLDLGKQVFTAWLGCMHCKVSFVFLGGMFGVTWVHTGSSIIPHYRENVLSILYILYLPYIRVDISLPLYSMPTAHVSVS